MRKSHRGVEERGECPEWAGGPKPCEKLEIEDGRGQEKHQEIENEREIDRDIDRDPGLSH